MPFFLKFSGRKCSSVFGFLEVLSGISSYFTSFIYDTGLITKVIEKMLQDFLWEEVDEGEGLIFFADPLRELAKF